jgi:pilus assembly protein FimV
VGKTSLVGSIIAGALFLLAGAAEGAGLGKLTVLSHLGEPLRAEIDVVAPEKRELDTLSARLASPEAYLQSNLPYPPSSLGLKMAIDHRANGEPYIKVTSAQPVPEPFVDLLVELNWQGGKILRAYTALLDPPAFAAAPPPVEAPAPQPEAAKPPPPPAPEPGVETRMGSEMQQPAPEAPAPEVAAAPAPTEVLPGEPVPPQPAPAPSEPTPPAPPAEAGMPPQPGSAPKEDSYGPVKRGDTLSKIAMEYKTDDVTLDQMLVLLFRNNKSAFSSGNMNRLKTGKVLSIPDPSEAADIPQKEARKEVRVQVADFNAYRERLASAAGATMPAPDQSGASAGGKVTGPVQDRATSTGGEPKEVLKLSQGEQPGAGGGKAMQDKLRSLEEEVAARDKTIHDANERIAKLEKTVKDMQGLLELKNKNMAELQKPAVTPPPGPAPMPAPPPAVTPPPVKSEPAPIVSPPVAPATGPMANSGTQPGIAAGAEAQPKPKPRPRVVAPPPPPPSLLDDLLAEPTYLIAGGAVLALILGFLGYRIIRSRRSATADSFGAEKKTSDVGAVTAAGGDTAALVAATTRAGASQPQIAEEVDPLAEAEIYLAYGRDGQAEEILKEALQNQPRRFEIHLKLLEIFAKRKDVPAFDSVARELQQATGGQGEIWLQAARLGYQIDPSNPRYAGGKPSAEAVAAAAAAAAASAVTATDKTLDFQIDSLEPSPEIGTLTDIDAGFGRRFATTTAATSADRLDLNVSVDDGQAPGTKTDIDLGKLGPSDATGVDLDLDSLGSPTAAASGTDINLATFGSEQSSEMPVMDFNLDLPASGEEKLQAEAGKADSVDFDLKLDDGVASTGGTALDFDIDRIALETGDAAKAEPMLDLDRSGPAMPEIDLSSINLDLGGAGPSEPEGGGAKDDKWYDVQTKFDLAKAYQEMGDKEGAREILREVIAEGDAEQKAAAHKVLETLG